MSDRTIFIIAAVALASVLAIYYYTVQHILNSPYNLSPGG